METTDAGLSRRDALVAAAVACVEEYGPHVGMAQIAERAGVPRPHVYRIIASKDELDAEVARIAAEQFLARVRPAVAQPASIWAVAHGSISSAVSWAAEHPQLYRFIAARQHARAASGPRQGRGRFLDLLVQSSLEYVRRAGREIDTVPEAVLAGIMGLIDASIIWWLDHHDESQDQLVTRLARQVTLIERDLLAQLGITVDEYTVLGAP